MTEVSWLPSSAAWVDDDWLIDKLGPPPTSARRKRSKKERRLIKKLEARLALKQHTFEFADEPEYDFEPFRRTVPTKRVAPIFEPVDWSGGPVKIVFCDFDGVLNDSNSGSYRLLAEQVARLDRLVSEAGARLVISSWWRWKGVSELATDLAAAGFTGTLIGRTPWLGEDGTWDAYERGAEVQAVLDHIGADVQAFVILDDHDRMGSLLPYLVQTDAALGLTDDDVTRALSILNAHVAV